MTDKKYTNEEIEKALSLCGRTTEVVYCDQCPLCGEYECNREIKVLALDLINRKMEEIEKLKEEVKNLEDLRKSTLNRNFELLNFIHGKRNKYFTKVNEIKAQSVKDFAERLKLHSYIMSNESQTGIINKYSVVTVNQIDNLVKEMVGE